MAIFSYKVAEHDYYTSMADKIKAITSEKGEGIDALRKMVEEYEETPAHEVPRLLPLRKDDPEVEEP